MIVRIWHGRVPVEKAESYLDYLRRTGVADYRKTPGNRGVQLLLRREGAVAHFLITSTWDSIESIRAFAGADIDLARYYPEDDEYLLEREPKVLHYEVLDVH